MKDIFDDDVIREIVPEEIDVLRGLVRQQSILIIMLRDAVDFYAESDNIESELDYLGEYDGLGLGDETGKKARQLQQSKEYKEYFKGDE